MLDYPPFAWWPVDKPGFADDIIPGHRPATMRVVTAIAIVAEDEVFGLGNVFGRHRVVWRRHDISLLQGDAVDKDLSIFNLHGLAGQANNTFDERVWGIKRRDKDYYLSSLWARGAVS